MLYCHLELSFPSPVSQMKSILLLLLLSHNWHNERIFPQSVKADSSCTLRNFIKPIISVYLLSGEY